MENRDVLSFPKPSVCKSETAAAHTPRRKWPLAHRIYVYLFYIFEEKVVWTQFFAI